MFRTIWNFLKNPIYSPLEGITAKDKLPIFIRLVVIATACSFILGIFNGLITEVLHLDIGDHAIEELFENYSLAVIFILGVVVAPLFEELLFRAPLVLFRNASYFRIIFYISVILFGAVHITNFEISPTVLVLMPLLVAPQLVAGIFLGYTRVKLGLIWAILLHAFHNALLFGPVLLLKLLGISIE